MFLYVPPPDISLCHNVYPSPPVPCKSMLTHSHFALLYKPTIPLSLFPRQPHMATALPCCLLFPLRPLFLLAHLFLLLSIVLPHSASYCQTVLSATASFSTCLPVVTYCSHPFPSFIIERPFSCSLFFFLVSVIDSVTPHLDTWAARLSGCWL